LLLAGVRPVWPRRDLPRPGPDWRASPPTTVGDARPWAEVLVGSLVSGRLPVGPAGVCACPWFRDRGRTSASVPV